jgi:beta-glucosidase-like glycosyl hydrolase/CubicO group peptidase (beta-lactamase class C family)
VIRHSLLRSAVLGLVVTSCALPRAGSRPLPGPDAAADTVAAAVADWDDTLTAPAPPQNPVLTGDAIPAAIRAIRPSLTEPLPASARRWIDRTINEMSLRDQVGQMVMIWVLGDYTSSSDSSFILVTERIQQHRVGGVVMSLGSPIEVAAKVNALQRRALIPLLVASDVEPGLGRLEGGVFSPGLLGAGSATVLPSNMAIGATRKLEHAREAGRITGEESRAVGIHLAFAPTADVNNNPSNPVINVRAFGEDPLAVAAMTSAFVEGVQDAGVAATVKHFPGHGDTDVDSHLALPFIRATRERLDEVELVPFRAAIASGVAAVMSAHIALPALHRDSLPATLDPRILTALLRDSLQFRGLVVTDAMDMRGIGAGYGVARSSVLAVKAGADVLLMPPDIPQAIDAVVAAVEQGEIPAERIAASVRRILELKLRTGAIQRPIVSLDSLRDVVGRRENRAQAQRIAEDAITLLRDDARLLPLRTADSTIVLTYASDNDVTAGRAFTSEMRAALTQMRTARITPSTPTARLDSLLRNGDEQVVIATFVRTIEGEGRFAVAEHVARWIDSVATRRTVNVVAFSSPYVLREFPRVSGFVATYGRGDAVERAAARVITGRRAFRGVPPTTLPGFYVAGQEFVRPLPRWASAVTDSVRAVLGRAVRDSVFPGGIAVIGTRTEVVAEVAVGKLDWTPDAPAPDGHTIWDIASLTKVVGMTTAMMQLVEQRRVSLDAPVQQYLPEWQGQWKDRVTVRHLLTHTSGLRGWRELYLEVETAPEAQQLVLATPLDTLPGVRYVYSDLGAILAGLIIERVSGESLDAYLTDHVFAPLGMSDTRYHPLVEETDRVAPTERDPWRGRHLRGEVHDENAYRLGGVSAHAGLFSTAADLTRFAQALLNGGELGGTRIVRPQTIASFTKVQDAKISHRALGWETPNGTNSAGRVMKAPAFGHTGFTGTSMWIDPANDLFIILLTNRVNPTRENSRIGPVRTTIADVTTQAAAGAAQASRGTP